MSNSKKVTENKGKNVSVRGKTIVASKTTAAEPIEPDATAEPIAIDNDAPAPATDSVKTTPTPDETTTPEPTTECPPRRDPRLPEAGTPIVRKWRGHNVVVKETDDGVFKVKVDSAYIGEARSLTKAAEMALATEGITSGVNGFAWFHVGEEAKSKHAATDRRLPALTAMVARIEERIQAAEDRANKLRIDRDEAIKQIDKIRAAMEAAAAAEATASED